MKADSEQHAAETKVDSHHQVEADVAELLANHTCISDHVIKN